MLEGPPGFIEEELAPAIGGRPELSETERQRLRELGRTSIETLRDPRCTPEIGRALVVSEFLFPKEKNGEDITAWEATPVLDELRKRADMATTAKWLEAVNAPQEKKLIEEIEELSKKAEASEDEEERKRLMVQAGFLGDTLGWRRAIVGRRQAAVFETEEWEKVYGETEAAASLQTAWHQREKLAGSVDDYAEKLFFSSMMIETVSSSKMVALLESPDVGPAIEKALETYIDIHLGLVPEEDCPRVLQQRAGEASMVEREKCFTYVRENCADKEKPWAQERGELLARHLATTTLLSVWLGVPRDETGEVIYGDKLPELGICTFDGESQPDLIKLIHFRLKTWAELNKGRPAGPPILAPVVPEFLTEEFFHSAEVGVKEDGTFCFPNDEEAKEVKSVFDAWYWARKEGKDVRLAEVLKRVYEGDFSFWVYKMFRENRVRRAFWEMDRDKMLAELWVPEALRVLNKDFQIAFGDRVLEREIEKINLVASRIIIWTGPEKKNTEVARMDKLELTKSETFIKYVRNACLTSGFFNEEEWELVMQIREKRRALTTEEILKTANKVTMRALLREGEAKKIVAITGNQLDIIAKGIERADKKVREVQAKVAEIRAAKKGKLEPGDFRILAQMAQATA